MASETLVLWYIELAQRWGFRKSHQQRNKPGILKYITSQVRAEEEACPDCQFHILAPTPLQAPSTGRTLIIEVPDWRSWESRPLGKWRGLEMNLDWGEMQVEPDRAIRALWQPRMGKSFRYLRDKGVMAIEAWELFIPHLIPHRNPTTVHLKTV